MRDINKLYNTLSSQLDIVNELLSRYVEDEVGMGSKQRYEDMTDIDKISLLTNTLLNCTDWCDFETQMVINFDMGCY
jgi:hypothetical protein